MEGTALKEERYIDLEDLIRESLSDNRISDDKEDLILDYLCQEISRADDYESIKRRADEGNVYAYIQLASWHITNAQDVRDYCIAYEYSAKAAKGGYMEAYYIQGQLYYYGVGCEKNIQRAIKCFDRFVKNVSAKELLNEAVLIDAYLKLAEAEKILGRFDRCLFYYHKLRGLDKKYESYLKEYEEEIRARQREYTAYFMIILVFVLTISVVGYFLFQHLTTQVQQQIHKYPEKSPVVMVEETHGTSSSTENDVPKGKISVEEPALYRVLSEDAFSQLQLKEITIASVDSSSEYVSRRGNDYSAENLLDEDRDTQWQEGEEDAGINQRIHFSMEEKAIVSGMRIVNGKQTSPESYYENNRVASFELFGQEGLQVELEDSMEPQYIVFENPVMISELELTIKSVFSGTEYNDTCITEITFYE